MSFAFPANTDEKKEGESQRRKSKRERKREQQRGGIKVGKKMKERKREGGRADLHTHRTSNLCMYEQKCKLSCVCMRGGPASPFLLFLLLMLSKRRICPRELLAWRDGLFRLK